jgi:ribosomal protein S18 acetylase RimI-like enzyme
VSGRVRPALARDLDALVGLWLQSGDHHAGIHPLFRMRPDPEAELRKQVRALLADPDTTLQVYDEDGRVLGVCALRVAHGEASLRETAVGEIADLTVAEGQRRRGIGRELAQAALAELAARGLRRAVLRVASGNVEGQAFWRALGFGDWMDVLERRL